MTGEGGGNKDKTVIGGLGAPQPLPGGVTPMPGGKRQVTPNERTVIGVCLTRRENILIAGERAMLALARVD